jgi:hypothetical protein
LKLRVVLFGEIISRGFSKGNIMRKAVIGLGIAVAFTAAAVTGARAGWGCGFSAPAVPGKFGSVWAEETEQAARDAAMQLCAKSFQGCYIVACKAGVDTPDQAYALWPLNGPKGNCFGNGC